jgi:hypothetical protein
MFQVELLELRQPAYIPQVIIADGRLLQREHDHVAMTQYDARAEAVEGRQDFALAFQRSPAQSDPRQHATVQ